MTSDDCAGCYKWSARPPVGGQRPGDALMAAASYIPYVRFRLADGTTAQVSPGGLIGGRRARSSRSPTPRSRRPTR
jgi:hypothetical protein